MKSLALALLTDAAAVEKLRAIAEGETAMLCTFVGTRLGSFWFFRQTMDDGREGRLRT